MFDPQGFDAKRRWLTLGGVYCLAFLGNSLAWSPFVEAQTQTTVDFAREVRPILSQHCTQCHGPDEETRQADLRLDTEDGLRSLAGDEVDYMQVLDRIESDDPDYRMPPPEANKDLTPDQVEKLSEWIAGGAHWAEHWSFDPPSEPKVPMGGEDEWSRTPIDQFVLAKLQAAGLQPSEDAPPIKLVRRLFLDLVGLLPTPEEADEWVEQIWSKNEAGETQVDEAAYQRLITRLLESPHYGERWARRWLDLARYADTNGYEKDRERSIWPYRDWVVNAFNADMPFDQFTVEQLAGDMLPNATREQRVATGFHRNTMLNEEGGIDPLEFRYHAVVDRVATTGTTWLGLTLGCCQCHTHKYDPISHTEYFEIFALLNNADEPHLELPDDGLERQWRENRQRAEALIARLPEFWPLPKVETQAADQAKGVEDGNETVPKRTAESQSKEQLRDEAIGDAFDKWLESEREHSAKWIVAKPTEAKSNLPILTIEDDHAIFASGDTAKRDDYWIELAPSDQPVTAIMLEALPDERLPERGPGSTYYEGTRGDFFLNEIEFEAGDKRLDVASATESFAKNRFGSNPVSAALALDGDVQTGWSVHDRQGERHAAVFNFKEPIPAGVKVRVHMVFGRHFASSLGRFRFRYTSSENEPSDESAGKPLANDYSDEVQGLLARDASEYDGEEHSLLRRVFLLQADELDSPVQEIRKLLKRPPATTSLVLEERSPKHPRKTYRHHRGEYLQAEEEVSSGVPDVVNLRSSSPQNRLEFAHWLVDGSNPLTARVVVNRAWAAFFGTGIVATVDDFGLQGEYPSHPELLDWLALRFMQDDQWSLKTLHRRIVSSSTYRQTSAYREDASEVDPANRLLSFFPRGRLEAEIIRDSLLFASGRLNAALGGPPVRPPQPAGVTEDTFGAPKWKASNGEDRYRRSLYTFQKRTAPFAMFGTFDAPSGEACIARRPVSNSPLQALTLLNDEMFLELARALAKGVQAESSEDADQLEWMFRRVLIRRPTRGELEKLEAFYSQQVERLAKSPDAVASLLAQPIQQVKSVAKPSSETKSDVESDGGDAPGEVGNIAGELEGVPRSDNEQVVPDEQVQLAALTLTARVVFGLDETINRE